MRNTYKILVANREGKRSLGKHRRESEDVINMDLKEVVCEVVEWINVS